MFTGRNEASDEKEKMEWMDPALLCGCLLAGCGAQTEIDDYATNSVDGSDEQGTESSVAGDNTTSTGIPKDEIKVGVIHLSDPADGSGHTYTHDLATKTT